MYEGQDVYINGALFNRIDEDGNRWLLGDLDGWWGLPDATVPDDPRPFQEDGSYHATGRYEARQITLSGYIIPAPGTAGHLKAASARNSLNRALNLVRSTAILQVDETLNGGPKIAAVQLVARPLSKFNDAKNVLEFNFQLRAADPRKYSLDPIIATADLETTAGGRTYNRTYDYTYGSPGSDGLMPVNNSGSYNTYGVLRINGPVIQPSVEHLELGRSIALDLPLGENEFVEINLKDKTVLLNGTASRRNKLSPSSQWFWFLPGDNTLRFTGYQVNEPRPGYPAAANLATNPSFETSFGTSGSRTNATANPRAVSGTTDWGYTPGTGEAGVLVAAQEDGSPAGVEVRRNLARSPQAIGAITGTSGGYGGSIANFGTFIDGTTQLTALVTPGAPFVVRTNYARDPRGSQGHSAAGAGWTYTPGTNETGVSISTTQTAVTRTNLYRNPRFAAPENSSGTFFAAESASDPFLGTCFQIIRTGGLGTNTFGAGLLNWTGYAPSTEYTVSMRVRATGQDLTGTETISVYLRPIGQASTTGQVLLGVIDQPAGEAVEYVFHGTTSAVAPTTPSLSLAAPTTWGTTDSAILVSDVTIELGSTSGTFFWGNTPETDLENDRHVSYRWAGLENQSSSEQVESIQISALGPTGQPGFLRQHIFKPKTTGTSGWVYNDTDAVLDATAGSVDTASVYVRSTDELTVQPVFDRRDGAGALVGTAATGSPVTLVPNVWTRVSVTDTAEGTSSRFRFRLDVVTDSESTSSPRGTSLDVTALLVERGSVLRDYFDGDFAAEDLPLERRIEFTWDGSVGDSPSRMSEAIQPADSEGTSVTGPIDGISNFARAVVVQAKTGGVSGWAGRSATHALPVSVVSGERYTVSIYVRYAGSAPDMTASLRMEFQTTAGTAAATFDSVDVSLPDSEWVRLSVSGVAAANYSYIGWSLRDTTAGGVPAESTIDITGLLVERSTSAMPGDYFDGNSQARTFTLDRIHSYSWSASANESTSIAELSVSPYATGPLEVFGLARWIVQTAKSTGNSDLYYHSATAGAAGAAGAAITGSMWVRSSAAVTVTPQVVPYDGVTPLTTITGATVDLSDGQWHRISASGTASGAFTRVRAVARLATGQTLQFGDIFDASSVLIDVGSSILRPYFDGEIKQDGVEGDNSWSGSEHASQSSLLVRGVKMLGPVGLPIAPNETTYQSVFQATSWSVDGSRSLGHTVTASPSTNTYALPHGTASGLTRLGLVAGSSYTISAFVNVPQAQPGTPGAGARSIALLVTGGGSPVFTSEQAPNAPGTYRLSVSFTLPLGATDVSLRLIHGATDGTLFWDGLMIEPGLSLSAQYFDGDSDFGSWSGTENDSTSSRPEIPAVLGATAEVMTRSAWIE
jgi:hypothetical protein